MQFVRVLLAAVAIAVSSTATTGNPSILACTSLETPASVQQCIRARSGNLALLACGSLETPALARQCMLEQQMADARTAGARVGAASPQVADASPTADEMAALQAREQMTAMVDERNRAILGPVGSGGGFVEYDIKES